MKFLCAILTVVLLLVGRQAGFSQGFLNLNFESAQIPPSTSQGTYIPISEALPDWSAYFISNTATDQTSQVAYDGLSTGGNLISIMDSHAVD
jgi:hypothetical protein